MRCCCDHLVPEPRVPFSQHRVHVSRMSTLLKVAYDREVAVYHRLQGVFSGWAISGVSGSSTLAQSPQRNSAAGRCWRDREREVTTSKPAASRKQFHTRVDGTFVVCGSTRSRAIPHYSAGSRNDTLKCSKSGDQRSRRSRPSRDAWIETLNVMSIEIAWANRVHFSVARTIASELRGLVRQEHAGRVASVVERLVETPEMTT